MNERKNVLLRILAMIFLVVSVQKLIRGALSGLKGNGYEFAEFGLSSTAVLMISIALILVSLYLFRITQPFFDKEEKQK